MIDFIKIEVPFYKRDALLKNASLDFKADYSLTTGETFEKKVVGIYNGMKFISFESGKLIIQGSIHKYYNFLQDITAPNQNTQQQIAKGFNGNTFCLSQLKFGVLHLCNILKIEPREAILRGFEYGLNVTIEGNCQTFLRALMMHGNLPFSIDENALKFYRQAAHQRYIIKCYDKQIQYGLDKPIIRFENKQMKLKDFENLPISSLEDLTKVENLEILKNLLLKKWREVLIYDFAIHKRKMSLKDNQRLKDLSNPNYWIGLKSNHRDRPRKKLKEYSIQYGLDIHNQFANSLSIQWDFQNKNCVTFNRLFKRTVV